MQTAHAPSKSSTFTNNQPNGASAPLPTLMEHNTSKGHDLAWDICTRLRANEFKDLTLGEIDDFRQVMADFLDLKKEW